MSKDFVYTALYGLILVCAFVTPVWGQTDNPGAPESVVQVVENVRLGARLEGGIFQSRLSIPPLESQNLHYLDRPVRSDISPVTTGVYGAGAGLRWKKDAELFVNYRLNSGMEPTASLRFRDGEQAIPTEYDMRQWTVWAQYFVFDKVGLGILLRGERELLVRDLPFTIAEKEIDTVLFTGSSERRGMSLYVPVRVNLARGVGLLARFGTSVYGRSNDSYFTYFTRYQDPERPDSITVSRIGETPGIHVGPTGLHHQFGHLGLEWHVLGLTWRIFFFADRTRAVDVSEEWRGGTRFQVGLPF